MTHICVSKLTIIVPDNGLSPSRRQAIIWTNAGILLIRTSATNFSKILSEIHIVSFKKMHLKMSSAKWRPFCLGLNVLTILMCLIYCGLWLRCVGKVSFRPVCVECIWWNVQRFKWHETQNRELSWCQLYCHRRHRRLLLWRPTVPPTTKKLAS